MTYHSILVKSSLHTDHSLRSGLNAPPTAAQASVERVRNVLIASGKQVIDERGFAAPNIDERS
jgi:hypothetical protein